MLRAAGCQTATVPCWRSWPTSAGCGAGRSPGTCRAAASHLPLPRRPAPAARPLLPVTRKVAGKPGTAMQTPEQAALGQHGSHPRRTLDRIVRQLQAIGRPAAAAVRRR